jgi:hypothetical protein
MTVLQPASTTPERAIEVELPKGHKLDSALTDTVKTAVSAACEAMSSLSEDAAEAVCAGRKTGDSAKAKSHPVEEDLQDAAVVPAI